MNVSPKFLIVGHYTAPPRIHPYKKIVGGLQRGPMTVVADENILGRWEILGDVGLGKAVVRCWHGGKSVGDALGRSPMGLSCPRSCCNREKLPRDPQWLAIYQLSR